MLTRTRGAGVPPELVAMPLRTFQLSHQTLLDVGSDEALRLVRDAWAAAILD